MTRDVDAFLEDAEDVIDDWESSPDVASWSADGSHEHDTDGDYYLNRPSSTVLNLGAGGMYVAPVGTPLPTLPPPSTSAERLYEVRIEVTSPDGEVVEFEVPRARFTIDRESQFDHDPWIPLSLRPPRIVPDRVQLTIEPVAGEDGVQYTVRDQRVASADG